MCTANAGLRRSRPDRSLLNHYQKGNDMGFLSKLFTAGGTALGGYFGGPTGAKIGGMLGGALGSGGGQAAIGSIYQNYSAKQAAARQMGFQREMFGSRYQMQMADMRKAGLNPMLSYMQGPPGGPGGSSYTPQNIATAGLQGALTDVTTETSAKKLSFVKRRAQAETIGAEAMAAQARAGANNLIQQRQNAQLQNRILLEKLQQEYPNTTSAKVLNDMYNTPAGKLMLQIERGGRALPFSSRRIGGRKRPTMRP